jgi:adenine-specific DNA-methyltransferase
VPRGKLELTWVGKDERPRLEPRVLVEDPAKSYGDPNSENMLIYGDNLLALRALEQDFAGQFKCIYIDPPFNIGAAQEHYDDNLEHSLWLSIMRDRLDILKSLLSPRGAIFIHIDDSELGYLLALADEVLGRSNRVSVVTFKQGSATGHKSINPGCVSTTNFVLIYARHKEQWAPNRLFTSRERNKRYNQFIVGRDEPFSQWRFTTLARAFAEALGVPTLKAKKVIPDYETRLTDFVMKHADSVVQLARPDYSGVGAAARDAIDQSKRVPREVVHLPRTGHPDMYFLRGERILFYADTLKIIDGQVVTGEPLTTLWDDIPSHNLHNEGGVEFPKGKKPEALIKRVVELTTAPGDWVLDSFAGSGTTGAAANKLGRRWVMVELREHCDTHIVPRLRRVIDGVDDSGISKAVGWKGGGGFKYYRLAETLLVQDKDLSAKGHPVYIVNPRYDSKMLIRAICKIEGFRYRNEGRLHGVSSENRFLHVTTQLLTQAYLDSLVSDVRLEQSLLVYCTRRSRNLVVPDNVEVKKIPRDLLDKCDYAEEVR